mmetsp:Transcript_13134/g.24120  ORF Transcript_13134/g.24120 Transcript_13134/m.24120 type:complete len:227 (-) Transcript_13134:2694-3374(-)
MTCTTFSSRSNLPSIMIFSPRSTESSSCSARRRASSSRAASCFARSSGEWYFSTLISESLTSRIFSGCSSACGLGSKIGSSFSSSARMAEIRTFFSLILELSAFLRTSMAECSALNAFFRALISPVSIHICVHARWRVYSSNGLYAISFVLSSASISLVILTGFAPSPPSPSPLPSFASPSLPLSSSLSVSAPGDPGDARPFGLSGDPLVGDMGLPGSPSPSSSSK